jgi:hypothetical protein
LGRIASVLAANEAPVLAAQGVRTPSKPDGTRRDVILTERTVTA